MTQREIPPEMAAQLRRAATTFAELGFERARIEDLAATTGVPSSTIYYYLNGKEGLLAFLLTDWLDAVAAAVDAQLVGPGPGADRLARVIEAQFAVMAEYPATCRVLLAENGRIARLPEIAEAVQAAFHRPLAKVLHDGIDGGEFRPCDVDATVAAVYGAVTFGGLHYLVAGDPIPTQVVDNVRTLLLHGIVRPVERP